MRTYFAWYLIMTLNMLRNVIIIWILGSVIACSSHAVTNTQSLSATPQAKLTHSPTAKHAISVEARQLAEIDNSRIREASGLVPSQQSPNVLWMINDGGNGPLLYAVDRSGRTLTTVRIEREINRDWEDLAAYTAENGQHYLVIADIGDNAKARASYRLIFIQEPKLAVPGHKQPQTASTARVIDFTYEDGARDAESIGIDQRAGKIYILSKREALPRLYSLPLPQGYRLKETQTARFVAELKGLPSPTLLDRLANPLLGGLASQPTAIDISNDGTQMAILTYRHVFMLERQNQESWQSAFSRQPLKLLSHSLTQAEAIGFDKNSRGLYFTSEHAPAPLWYAEIPRPQHEAD